MAIHIGRERAGWKGLFVAGLCFILPAVLITGILAVLYKSYGHLPRLQPFIYGIKPAVIAIIIAAVYPLGRKSLKSIQLGIIGIATLILSLAGINEIYVLFGAGLIALGLSYFQSRKNHSSCLLPFTWIQFTTPGILGISNAGLFFTFLKVGAVLYGSGYVLFAFLDAELVAKGIISRQLLIDAIAVGQFTPGPVFSSVTFIGYQINNAPGAIAATIGIFLPSFLFVALLNPLVRIMRNSKRVSAFLDAVNVASVSIIAAVCFEMGKDAISGWKTIVIALASLVVVFGFKKFNSALVVLLGSGLGYLLSLI
jgi:chromate transporter